MELGGSEKKLIINIIWVLIPWPVRLTNYSIRAKMVS